MKVKQFALATALGAVLIAPAMAQGVLTGDTRSACEAILCLASGTRPNECIPPLARFFSISFRRLSDTLRGRTDFLNLCPAASMDSNMRTLVNDIANGAGRCDAASMNASNMVWRGNDDGGYYINNAMPGYCTSYTQNVNTDLRTTVPLYVGVPERNGFWVEPAGYSQALAEYNARIAAEDAARAASNQSGGG